MQPAPFIVPKARSAGALAALLRERLVELGFAGEDPLRDALVRIGARYGEILVEHLNAAPQRHLDVFLAALGLQPAPSTPASVALAFTPVTAGGASGSAASRSVVVPTYTPVAAPPSGDDTDVVVFETERELDLVRAAMAGAWGVDPLARAWVDASAAVRPAGFEGKHLFAAAQPIESALHVGAPLVLGLPHLRRIRIELKVLRAATWPPATAPQWGLITDAGFEPLRVESDSTQQFTRSGVVELIAPAAWPARKLGGAESNWLTCRLAASPAPRNAPGTLPLLAALRVGALAHVEVGEAPLAVCWGNVALDTSRDFFPFGERPRFGDVMHLMAESQLGVPGARVVVVVQLTNPADGSNDPLPAVDRSGKPRVQWEAHTSRGWVALTARDGTKAFTQDGEISFTLPAEVKPCTLAGQQGHWVRARLAAGHYGAPKLVDGMVFPSAPSIRSLLLHSTIDIAPQPPALLRRSSVLELTSIDPTAAFEPFTTPDLEGATLILAIDAHEPLHAGRKVSLQVEPSAPTQRPVRRSKASATDPDRAHAPDRASAARPLDMPRWQLRTTEGWRDCRVTDESAGFTQPGTVVVELPAAPAPWPVSTVLPAASACWLRAVWPAAATPPSVRRLVLNAVRARQTQRLRHELLGSSTAKPNQTFTALRTPIFADVVLQVRDAEAPQEWVAWKEVTDFAASDPRSAHYTLDRRSGVIRFGNGAQGRIPPAGANNIRLLQYHVGGGRRGNVAAGAVAQLRTTVPYVDAVTNPEAAAGGQDAGDATTTQRAASGWLRHRDRAVCADDYVDLCHAAAPDVARAWCIGNRDLDAPPTVKVAPGVVSLVVMPHGAGPQPQPSPDLLARIQAFLDTRRPLNTELVLLGPDYAGVSVQARVATASGWSIQEVGNASRKRLMAFLHPVDGGDAGMGWAPGQRPHRSDLVAVAGAVDGVDHVVELRWSLDESGLDADRRALAFVCAGTIEVTA
jgi:predicted phage baseplate assembly protein